MTAALSHRREVNEIKLASLAVWLCVIALAGICALAFVYVKNQQHMLGTRTREIERQIRDVRAQNDVLATRISRLSSHAELQRKLDQGFISLTRIQDHRIARLVPPSAAGGGDIPRTAANEGYRR